MDNYEWANANLHNEEKTHISEFGLYKNRVKNDQTGELLENYQNHETMLKPSGQHYKNIVTQQKGNS